MEKTRAQIRLERLAQEQERLKQETAKARVEHRQQRRRQRATHASQLGQLMQVHGFENVTLEQTEEWLKMALITTPLTVMDEVASMTSPPEGEGGGSESANWPTSQPQLKGTEAPHTPSLETGLEGTGVQNSRTSEPETEGRHSN